MNEPKLCAEPLLRCVLRSAGLGALASTSVAAAECGKLLLQRAPRYSDLALEMVGVGLVGYAILGVLLGGACGVLAWLLWRRPTFRAASASTCAATGTLLGTAAFVVTPQVGAALLPAAAALGTLLALSLREILDWVAWPTRARLWLALGGGLLFFGSAVFAVRGGSSAGARTQVAAAQGLPNVLLVTIDTLRSDHIGAYGADDAMTPTIDALAKESVLFFDATSQANTTGPSHTTMLTGLYPSEHGARHNGVPIANGVRTLPEMLASKGYQTAAEISGFTLKQEACGLAPRFEHYGDELIAWRWMPEVAARLRLFQVVIQLANQRGLRALRADRPASESVDRSLAWLSKRDRSRPYFLWTHFYDPHCPYQPPPPFDRLHDEGFEGDPARNWYKLSTAQRCTLVADPREVEHMRSLYKGEISYTDAQLGRMFERMKAAGDLENTLVILTSDHGEGLGEHDYWFDHGTFLYDSELSVPLLLRLPDGRNAGTRVGEQVRLLDLTPTVLEVVGMEIPATQSGSSLLATMGASTRDPRPSFAQGDMAGELSGYDLDGRLLSLRVNGHKLIWTSDYWLDSVRVPEQYEFYDLERDRGEASNLLHDEAPQAAAAMRAQIGVWREQTASPGARSELSNEVRSQLQSLGY